MQPPPPSVGSVLGYQVGFRTVDDDASDRSADEGWEWRVVRAGATDLGGQGLVATLSPLRHYTRYEVVVRAFNQVGHGPASPPLFVITQEGGEYLPRERCVMSPWNKV